jgi:aminomethyltransferase
VRSGADIVGTDGGVVGKVTSGTVSPTLGKPIMMGYLTTHEDTALSAVVRGRAHLVKITKLPFVPKRYKR